MTKKRQKELKRVRSFIRRAEKRGYIFDDAFKEGLASRSTRSLQFLTPKKMYEQAQFKLGETLISGLRGRYVERERAAIKGAFTRAQKNKLEPERGLDYLPTEDNLVYQMVEGIIAEFPSSEGAQYLDSLLKSEIKNYGLFSVIKGMSQAPEDLVKMAQEIIYYELNSTQLHNALKSFSEAIRGGVVLTKEESRAFNEAMEGLQSEDQGIY